MDTSYSPVAELNALKELQDELGFGNYADGFGLFAYGDTSWVDTWSQAPEFAARLVPFARANASGSFYALWRLDDRTDLATLPVVVFGDEGGMHVVARDLRELFRLLGFDAEIRVFWDCAYFYREPGERHTDGHSAYAAWLDRRFGLLPADAPDALVAAAQEELGRRFEDWAEPWLAG
ncbi:hypothetical protein [Streptomyces cinereospinus]|uniref:SMI1/KNR4 family protein n=1 Tax=Streptomyces cinereospinus TaxID=285561 RepID=A0ABV5N6J0_9ACTN